MLWLLLLHIAAMICWCGALLYLPSFIVVMGERHRLGDEDLFFIPRRVFTHFATPAALIAIISGTGIFLLDHTDEVWLVAKLTLVSALVICHVLAGRLTLLVESKGSSYQRIYAALLGLAVVILTVGILWLVLAEPV